MFDYLRFQLYVKLYKYIGYYNTRDRHKHNNISYMDAGYIPTVKVTLFVKSMVWPILDWKLLVIGECLNCL